MQADNAVNACMRSVVWFAEAGFTRTVRSVRMTRKVQMPVFTVIYWLWGGEIKKIKKVRPTDPLLNLCLLIEPLILFSPYGMDDNGCGFYQRVTWYSERVRIANEGVINK